MLNLALSLDPLRGDEHGDLSPFSLSPLPSPSPPTGHWSQKGTEWGGKGEDGIGSCRADQKQKQGHLGEMEWEKAGVRSYFVLSSPWALGPLRSSLWLMTWGTLPGTVLFRAGPVL